MEGRHSQKDTGLSDLADQGRADRRVCYPWNDRIPGYADTAQPPHANWILMSPIESW